LVGITFYDARPVSPISVDLLPDNQANLRTLPEVPSLY